VTSGRRLCDWVYIGTGILLPAHHVVERICELAGTSVPPQFGGMPDRPGKPSRGRSRASAPPARRTPSTDLDTRLARTLAWYQ
jgi:hypothetical protein